ncbi:alanine--tRNA ligase [Candidatus Saccharibacteria bacterium]|nr:alanine--tRNA ligase [Candidatus Saccharibacteria bacterium]MBR6122067.1 alanine--tRNA ligase [Candidatus Saccharibacteria bacterium]
MNASEIRQKFLEFQESKGHKVIAPAPLVLENDPTTLFTGSGMQPLLRYLLGEKHPDGTRLSDSQPCLRLQDIEDVGDPRHTTVFEMLGNWSLGDYFKKEQIENYFEFLTQVIGLDPEKIFVTCFIGSEKYGIPKDEEAAKIWQGVFEKAGVEAKIVDLDTAENGDKRGIKPGERIFFYNDKENWWSRGGGIETTPIGDPCGPDSEVFYDFGEDKQDVEKYGKSHPASDGARFMEIGNQVFMQYRRNEDGTFSELEHKNVDFGGGLERLCAAQMGSFDVFKISLMQPIIEKLEQLSGKSYDNNTDEMRIICDHLRGAYLLAAQGLAPSNKAQGYALRRLIRRAILKALDLGIAQDFLRETISPIEDEYKSLPDSILTNREHALEILEKEERAFRQTLNKGLKELEKIVRKQEIITGQDIFKLQDTYGFPYEISIEEIFRQNLKLSEHYKDEFDQALAEQRERSKTASKGMFKGGLEDHGEQTTKYHTATHLCLAALQKHVSRDICQKGSNITADRMRFDFNCDHKLAPEEIKTVEDQVNGWIKADLPVIFAEYDKAYARDTLKAHGQFWDKYPDKLKVYTIGDEKNPVSREVCGGPHVEHTGVLGHFKIQKEESSSAGVRRIKAVLE